MSLWRRFFDWMLWHELERDPFYGRGYARPQRKARDD